LTLPRPNIPSVPVSRPDLFESIPEFFYRNHRESPKYDAEKDYSAAQYYKRAPVDGSRGGRHDALLALYRDPPAWDVLEAHSAALLAKSRSDAERRSDSKGKGVAAVDRTKIDVRIQQMRLDALRANARRKSEAASNQTPKVSTPPAVRGNNPFRRQSTGSGGSHGGDSERSGMKPLKPISQVPIPILPTKPVKALTSFEPTKSAGVGNGNSTKPDEDLAQSAWTGLDHGSGNWLKRSIGGAEEEIHRKKIKVGVGKKTDDKVPAGKSTKSSKASAGSTRRSSTGAADPSCVWKKGFDWGTWAQKS